MGNITKSPGRKRFFGEADELLIAIRYFIEGKSATEVASEFADRVPEKTLTATTVRKIAQRNRDRLPQKA